jgi:hypothetical protein
MQAIQHPEFRRAWSSARCRISGFARNAGREKTSLKEWKNNQKEEYHTDNRRMVLVLSSESL